MRMMRFKSSDGFRLGVVVGGAVADLTAIEIEGIGILRNQVANEQAQSRVLAVA